MDRDEIKILIETENVSWFCLLDNNRQLLSKDVLRIYSIPEQNRCYMRQENFYFAIQKQIPFISATFKTHRTYIFPHTENGFNAICVELDDPVITQLEIILSNFGTLIPKENLGHQDETLRNSINAHCVNIFETPLVDDDQGIHYIKKGGNILKDGFMWLGNTAATGVNKAGDYICSKITTTKKVEVSSQTKEKFNKFIDATQSAMEVTSSILGAVLTPVVKVTGYFVDHMNQKIEEGDNQTLKKIKKFGGATLDATSDALSGLATGAASVGISLAENTRYIVQKKYGGDITNTFVEADENNNQDQQQQQQQQQEQQGDISTDKSNHNLLD